MRAFSSLRLVFSVALLTFVSAHAADPNAAAQATLERIQNLRKERSRDGVLAFYEALVRIQLGERATAFETLRSLIGRKLGLIPVRGMGFDPVWDDPEFRNIRDQLEHEEPRTPAAPVAFRFKDPKLIPECIAYDPDTRLFFLSSLAQRKIIVVNEKGEAHDFSNAADKLDCVLGMVVDASAARLYAVSTNGFLDEAQKERRNAVACYDIKSGKLVDRFAAPAAMQLNDVAIAADGTIYATDSMTGTLFRKKPAETQLSPFGAAGTLRGANGITLSSDEVTYVAISTGIARVNPATGEATRLLQPDDIVTAGCDGLYWYDGDLLGIQNSTNPGRVIRISLADNGTRAAGLTVLQSHHHPDFSEPTTGAIANGALNVIANSYVGKYQPDGRLTHVDELKGTAVVAVPLGR